MKKQAFGFVGLVVVSLLASACQDSPVAAPPVEQLPALGSGQVHAMVRQERGADGLITFVVRVRAKDVGVNAFQGAVTFAPGAYELVAATTPGSSGGAAYVLNSGGFAEGRIRFAAFSPVVFNGTESAEGVEAFRFTVRPARPDVDSAIEATLDVVSRETSAPQAAPVRATEGGAQSSS